MVRRLRSGSTRKVRGNSGKRGMNPGACRDMTCPNWTDLVPCTATVLSSARSHFPSAKPLLPPDTPRCSPPSLLSHTRVSPTGPALRLKPYPYTVLSPSFSSFIPTTTTAERNRALVRVINGSDASDPDASCRYAGLAVSPSAFPPAN